VLRRWRETCLNVTLLGRRSRVESDGILCGLALRVKMLLAEKREAKRYRVALAASGWRIA